MPARKSPRDKNALLNTVFAAIGALAALVTIYEFVVQSGSPSPSTSLPTRVLAPDATVPGPSAAFTDDFSGPDFNSDHWMSTESDGCAAQPIGGRAVFSSDGSPCLIRLSAPSAPFGQVGSIAARLSASNPQRGSSMGIIEFSHGTFDPGTTTWITECGIRQAAQPDQLELFFRVWSTYPQGNPEIDKARAASPGQWYKFKLEILEGSTQVQCSADDQLLGTYQIPNIGPLLTGTVDRHLFAQWAGQSQAIYYVDDAQVSGVR